MDTWTRIRELAAKLQTLNDFPEELLPILANHLEDSITTDSHNNIGQLSDDLRLLWDTLFNIAPPSAANAALGASKTPEYAAFILGQVGFAQLLASQVAEQRADDQFTDELKSPFLRNYIKALADGELTGKDLARIVNETDETVSRKLKRLRELGITEFRSEGTRRLNFLTPAALSAYTNAEDAKSDHAFVPNPPYPDPVHEITRKLPEFMRSPPSFAARIITVSL